MMHGCIMTTLEKMKIPRRIDLKKTLRSLVGHLLMKSTTTIEVLF